MSQENETAPRSGRVFLQVAAAPAGASINPTNGVFQWRPVPSQGTTTNAITVIVTDVGPPEQSASITFTIVVPDYVEPGFGRTVLLAGDSGNVPLTIFSSVGLTNFNLKLLVPTNRFASFGLSNVAPEVATSLVNRLSDTEARVPTLGWRPESRWDSLCGPPARQTDPEQFG